MVLDAGPQSLTRPARRKLGVLDAVLPTPAPTPAPVPLEPAEREEAASDTVDVLRELGINDTQTLAKAAGAATAASGASDEETLQKQAETAVSGAKKDGLGGQEGQKELAKVIKSAGGDTTAVEKFARQVAEKAG